LFEPRRHQGHKEREEHDPQMTQMFADLEQILIFYLRPSASSADERFVAFLCALGVFAVHHSSRRQHGK
jgi:hypothetical protein